MIRALVLALAFIPSASFAQSTFYRPAPQLNPPWIAAEEKTCEHCGSVLTDEGRCPYCQPKPSSYFPQALPLPCQSRFERDINGRIYRITHCGAVR